MSWILARKKKLLMPKAGVVPTTLNPFDASAFTSVGGGNLQASYSAAGQWVRSVASNPSGKFYFEVTVDAYFNLQIGVANAASLPSGSGQYLGKDTDSFALFGNGFFYINNGSTNTGMAFTSGGTIVCVAVDIDANLVWYRINNGNWNNAGNDPAIGTGGIDVSALTGTPRYVILGGDSGGQMTVNFGATAFTYTPPAGFGVWG